MTTPTAPLTTAAEMAREFLEQCREDELYPQLVTFLTTYAAQVRRDAIEECAKLCDLIAQKYAESDCDLVANAIRALSLPAGVTHGP